jgi:hypothetical protein
MQAGSAGGDRRCLPSHEQTGYDERPASSTLRPLYRLVAVNGFNKVGA